MAPTGVLPECIGCPVRPRHPGPPIPQFQPRQNPCEVRGSDAVGPASDVYEGIKGRRKGPPGWGPDGRRPDPLSPSEMLSSPLTLRVSNRGRRPSRPPQRAPGRAGWGGLRVPGPLGRSGAAPGALGAWVQMLIGNPYRGAARGPAARSLTHPSGGSCNAHPAPPPLRGWSDTSRPIRSTEPRSEPGERTAPPPSGCHSSQPP